MLKNGVARSGWVPGFSLLELSVATALGCIFSLSLVQVYLHSKMQYNDDQAYVRLQENGSMALHILTRELVHAGFYGGLQNVEAIPLVAVSRGCVEDQTWALNPRFPLELFNGVAGGADPLNTVDGREIDCLSPGDIQAGSDVLVVKRVAGSFTARDGELNAGSVVKNGQWYLRVRDRGERADWFYHRQGGFPESDMGVGSGVDYWAYFARIFYVRRFSVDPDDGIPTLCSEGLVGGMLRGAMATRCLVEGVEDMQIEFGVDLDGDGIPNQYLAALDAGALTQVVSARVSLLIRSHEGVSGPVVLRTYQLGGKEVSRLDNYARRVFSSSIRIRNLS